MNDFPKSQFPALDQHLRDLGKKRKQTATRGAVEAANAVLVGAKVTFRTLNDDKDDDTCLEVWVNKPGGAEAAYSDYVYGHFDDWSYQPVQLKPKSNVMTKAELLGASIRVRIHPHGNDTWKFQLDPAAELYFSDGTLYSKAFLGGTTIDQNINTADFYL